MLNGLFSLLQYYMLPLIVVSNYCFYRACGFIELYLKSDSEEPLKRSVWVVTGVETTTLFTDSLLVLAGHTESS